MSRTKSIRKQIGKPKPVPHGRPLPAWLLTETQRLNRRERRAAEAIKRKENSNAATRTQT